MKKLSTGSYQDTHNGTRFMVSKVRKAYTNARGHKSYATGWGFVIDGDVNGTLEPAYASRKQACALAVREIDRRSKAAVVV